MKEKLLFKTLSGSRLYGTYNENSDLDYSNISCGFFPIAVLF